MTELGNLSSKACFLDIERLIQLLKEGKELRKIMKGHYGLIFKEVVFQERPPEKKLEAD